MSWRKWLVRLLVFSVLGGCAFAVLLYQRWTDPAAVRAQVVESLQQLFPGASISLDGARLNLFGGIVLSELRLSRKDDPDSAELLHVPSVVVYHDKEHLLDGKFAFRKVELLRPRLRLQRGRDGRWNVAGLIDDKPKPSQARLPTLVVKQGTIILDDRLAGPGTPVLEVADVSFTVTNDPDPTVTFEGSGASAELGAVQLRGTWQRPSGAVSVSAEAGGVPLTPLLVQRLAAHCPDGGLAPFPLQGRADVRARADYQPASGSPLSYEVRCDVHEARIDHPSLPLVLENLEASALCADGRLTVERLTATSGPAQVKLLRGTAKLPHPANDFESIVSVSHLPLTEKLFEKLPEGARWLYPYFEPVGQVTVQTEMACAGGRWVRHHYTLRPEDLRICCQQFRYPLKRLAGVVTYDYLQNRTDLDVKGEAGGQPVTVRGDWTGTGKEADVHLVITATGLKIDEALIKALPADGTREAAEAFAPSGHLNAKVWILHTPGVEAYQNKYLTRFYDTKVKWRTFPYPLEKVTGELLILPTHWEFHNFSGSHHGGQVTVRGRTFPETEADRGKGPRLLLDIRGRDIALDDDLKSAFERGNLPGMVRTWETFNPAGRLNFGARIDRPAGSNEQGLDITLDVHGCSLMPTFFPYALHDVCGQIRYYKDQILLDKFTARHRDSRLSLERGVVDLYGPGGFYADLTDLGGNPVVPDQELLAAVPDGLRSLISGVGLRDPFAVRTRLVIAQSPDAGSLPDAYWDGQLWVRDAKLQLGADLEGVTGTAACVGRHNGRQLLGLSGNALLDSVRIFKQPFRNAHARLQVKPATPEVLNVDLNAPLFGGSVSGQARVELLSDLRYELNLTASQIRLEELARHNLGTQAQLSGVGAARLHLTGRGEGVASLEGNGTIDVPYTGATRLYNLPLLLDLLKFLGLRWPDRTLFEEAHAVFNIHGNRATISQLDLLGNVVSLWGRGDVNLDGTDIQLDFYPSWARLKGMLPGIVQPIPPAISKNLLKIEVRGKVTGDPKDIEFHKMPVPALVEPILQVRDMVWGKKSAGSRE
jgi:hypothetical protein